MHNQAVNASRMDTIHSPILVNVATNLHSYLLTKPLPNAKWPLRIQICAVDNTFNTWLQNHLYNIH